MKNRITKKVVMAAILCVLMVALVCSSAFAASYSKVYGKTQDKLRVRASASASSVVIDNIKKDAAVYITASSMSGSSTFVKINYRNSDGDISSGWLCQNDGRNTYVKVLSADQAKSAFNVTSGTLPSAKVGTFSSSERRAATTNAGVVDTSTLREVQQMLKNMGIYSGEITGNAGEKTVAAIKEFQRRYGLVVDGVAGANTYAKMKSVAGGSSSSASANGALKLNSTGTAVRNLQQDLTTLGYYWAEVTGNFGSKTEAAVKNFQSKNGLTADGVAGGKTLDAIAAALSRGGHSSSISISTSGILYEGIQSSAVSSLQQALKDLGYYSGSVTGNFGSLTKAAVAKFQSANGLSADGIAGTKTIELINSKASSSSSSTTGLKLGSTGDKVRALQQDLTALGYYYGDITGHYGEMTKAAVLKFQKARKLPSDGVAGITTQNAITSALGNSGALASTSATTNSSSLREGDKGELVTELQTRLKKLGYYYGEITGSYGSLTKKAVRQFQDDNDLTVDGVAGNKTLSLVYSKTGSTYNGTTIGSAGATTYKYGRINKENVNLRKSYSTSSGTITKLDKDEPVRITKTYNIDGMDWYYLYVKEGDVTHNGYVRSDLVTIIDTDSLTDAEKQEMLDEIDVGDAEVIGMIKVTGTKVNLREEDDSDSDHIGYAYAGDVFYYINKSGNWYQTMSGAWIHSDYVRTLSGSEMAEYIDSEQVAGSYRKGDTGSMVLWIQETLDDLGYYDGEKTGKFGNLTHEAVRQFQRDNELGGDGIVGGKTLTALKEAAAKLLGNVGSSGTITGTGNLIFNLDWFTYKNNKALPNVFGIKAGRYGTLVDVQKGKSFDIKVQSTGNHIDAEPKTSSDTKVLASLYGVGSGAALKGVYQRRPMILTMDGSKLSVLVSIYPEPHGDDTISGNGYDGQFCLHMVNSKTHGTNRVDNEDNGHQETLKKAAAYLVSTGINGVKYAVSTVYPATSGSTTGSVNSSTSSDALDKNDSPVATKTPAPTKTPKPTATPAPNAKVVMDKNVTVYTGDSWSYYHTDKDCPSLAGKNLNMSSYAKAFRNVTADKKRCPDCKSVTVYYGNTSSANYHYSASCYGLAKHNYTEIWESTEAYAKTTGKRTHVCDYCNSNNTINPYPTAAPTPVPPVAKKATMWPETLVYVNPDGSKVFHTNVNCQTMRNVAGSNLSAWVKYYKSASSGRTECPTCNTKYVYFGDKSKNKYHYKWDCDTLVSYDYDVVYQTTTNSLTGRTGCTDCD